VSLEEEILDTLIVADMEFGEWLLDNRACKAQDQQAKAREGMSNKALLALKAVRRAFVKDGIAVRPNPYDSRVKVAGGLLIKLDEAIPIAEAQEKVVEAARELELRARANRDHATMNGLRRALRRLEEVEEAYESVVGEAVQE
jgi:hypothetical protein